MSDVLAAALDYAARGWPVFPCRADNKRPHTEHGFKEASTAPDTIRAWWRRWPDAMVACPTGPAVGAWVLDVDDPAAFEPAAGEIGLPATARSDTGKGYHLWFAYDAAEPVRNAQRTPKGWPFAELPGAEVRGDGGYVILPPSMHPSGRRYAWARDEEPSEAPADLLAIVRRSPPEAPPAREAPMIPPARGEDTPYGLRALTGECDAIRCAPAGAQETALNHGALKIGGLVAGGALMIETATAKLMASALGLTSHNAGDPWTPAQLATKIDRALRDGMRTPRSPEPREAASPRAAQPTSSKRQVGAALAAGVSAAALMQMQFAPVRYVVEGYIAEGLTLLAGAPKIGKSWLVMGMGVAVASVNGAAFGSATCEHGDVLYLALEDNNRRLKRRLVHMGVQVPERLTLVTAWPSLDEGCLEEIEAWIRSAAQPMLVILDVLTKVRPAADGKTGAYEADYRVMTGLQGLAGHYGIAIIVVHHTRKMEAEDPFDSVSGTRGLTGAADSVLVFKRDIGTGRTILYGRGREIEEIETAFEFNRDNGTWSVVGVASEVAKTTERQAILDVLRETPNPLTAREVSDVLDHPYEAVRKTLARMWRGHEVEKKGRGQYTCPNGPNVPNLPESSPQQTVGTLGTQDRYQEKSAPLARAVFPHGNPSLRPVGAPIFAPGESPDDPVVGWD